MAKFIDITTHGGSRDGGQNGSPSEAIVREYLMDMYHMCLGMKDLEAAMPTLYLMEKCLRKNGIRDPELLSLPSLVEDYFRKKNEPQPSTKIEGCNVNIGDGSSITNQMKVDVKSPGNYIAKKIKLKIKEEEYGRKGKR